MSNSTKSPARVMHGGNRHRQVAMIELATVNHAVRRSKIAFWVVGSIVAVTTTVVASAITTLYKAIGLGMWAGIVSGFLVGLTLFVWPAVRVLWHWATELAVLAAFLSSYGLLTATVPWWLALTLLGVGVTTPLLFARSRTLLVGWAWCLISRHRLRVCFASFVAAKRTGMTPLILGARPTPAGERVWIWLRPGLALGDLEPQLEKLAAGCWAAECRLTPASRRYSALLRLDIARRNPLTAKVGSPLPGLVPAAVGGGPVMADAYVSTGGLDLPDVPDTAITEQPATAPARRQLSATAKDKPLTVDDILAAKPGGDDLSDWI